MAEYQNNLTVILHQLSKIRPLLPMYAHLLASALFPIYAGAHASLSRPASAAKPIRVTSQDALTDEDGDEEEAVQKMESLGLEDAVILPVTAGVVLAGLYWVITKYGEVMINAILSWYFAAVGLFSVSKLLSDGMTLGLGLVFPRWYWAQGTLWRVDGPRRAATTQNNDKKLQTDTPLAGVLRRLPLPSYIKNALWKFRSALSQRYALSAYLASIFDFQTTGTAINVIAAMIGPGFIAYANLVHCPWWLTNLQGFAVSYSALQLMSPTTFATGSLILSGLFVYDIWAVFFTPLMVTVAKGVDQPIKLMFPRPDTTVKEGEPPLKGYSMLGLGDIVLPGIMIGLALRYDLHIHYLRKQKQVESDQTDAKTDDAIEKAPFISPTGRWGDRFWTLLAPTSALPQSIQSSSFPKPYFTASTIGYVVGMVVTLGVMSVYEHPQPALLYLVPGVLISLWGTAVVRGELKQVLDFTEGLTGEAEEENEEVKGEQKSEDELGVVAFLRMLWQGMMGAQRPDRKVATSSANQQNEGGQSPEKSDEGKQRRGEESRNKKEQLSGTDKDTLLAISIRRMTRRASERRSKHRSSRQTSS